MSSWSAVAGRISLEGVAIARVSHRRSRRCLGRLVQGSRRSGEPHGLGQPCRISYIWTCQGSLSEGCPRWEVAMLDEAELLQTVRQHWEYPGEDDLAHEIYRDDAVLEFPQSGE